MGLRIVQKLQGSCQLRRCTPACGTGLMLIQAMHEGHLAAGWLLATQLPKLPASVQDQGVR